MPVTAIFDNAALNDVLSKAARVAPVKGEAFDKCAGIEFHIHPGNKTATVRATDMNVTYEATLALLEVQGKAKVWRLPSQLISSLVSTFPMGDGAATEFIDQEIDSSLRVRCGRIVSKINMFEGGFNSQNIFDWNPQGHFLQAHDLAAKVEQVSWATDSKSAILQGVHITGEHLFATDTQVMARVTAKIDIPAPITVPLTTLSQLLSTASDCRIGSSDKRCLLQFDENSRASSVLLEAKFPDVQRAMRENFTGSMKLHRQQFMDTLERLMVLARMEKLPTLKLSLDAGGLVSILTLDLDIPDISRIQDSLDVETEYDDIFEASFTPNKIQKALSHARTDFVHIDFGHPDKDKGPLSLIRLRDEKDYIAYIMPRRS